MEKMEKTIDSCSIRFNPTLCVTHNCNLHCVYCYQKHDGKSKMSIETAKKSIDWIFSHKPCTSSPIEISFIGGEPLLEFPLIKNVVEYVDSFYQKENVMFSATTNGTLLDDNMKDWFAKNKKRFVLCLSLDGAPLSHNHNRCDSFDKIDTSFFIENWPNQSVKMTISDYSLPHLAENIKFIFSLGFKNIGGVNLFEGDFDWSSEKYIQILIPQLEELVKFYTEHDDYNVDQMLNLRLDVCEFKNKRRRKWCGIGEGTPLFNTDGKIYPCAFCTPMTFDKQRLSTILKTNFADPDNFIDDDCFERCYLYPVCHYCAGANYLVRGSFKNRDKTKCRINKLIALYSADLQMKRILKSPEKYAEPQRTQTIRAINKIRQAFLSEFISYQK